LAAVRVEETADSKYGFVDQRGALVIKPAFNQAGHFSQGLAAVETSGRIVGNHVVDIAWGYVDHSGAFAISPKFQLARDFSEGLAAVAFQPGMKWGYINREGKTAIAPVFTAAFAFSDGLAAACSDQCAYIDPSGAPVIDVDAQWAFFSRGSFRGG
jgi:hypothetical protein